MWTVSTQCRVFGSTVTDAASSKSRASTGSTVTTNSSVKSVRPARSVSENAAAASRASSSAAGGNSSGRPNDLMIEIRSTPGLVCGPSTSVMTPSPRLSGVGNRSISTTTLSCGRAPFAPGSPTATLCANTVPSTRTSPSPSRSKYVPTNVRVARPRTRTISPAGSLIRVASRVTRTSTSSPVEASRVLSSRM